MAPPLFHSIIIVIFTKGDKFKIRYYKINYYFISNEKVVAPYGNLSGRLITMLLLTITVTNHSLFTAVSLDLALTPGIIRVLKTPD